MKKTKLTPGQARYFLALLTLVVLVFLAVVAASHFINGRSFSLVNCVSGIAAVYGIYLIMTVMHLRCPYCGKPLSLFQKGNRCAHCGEDFTGMEMHAEGADDEDEPEDTAD